MTQRPQQARIDARVLEYYGLGREARRLRSTAGGVLEFRRTQEIVGVEIARLVDSSRRPELCIADVGGATGIHAAPLAEQGHVVTLVDPVPEQVRLAEGIPGVFAQIGDARELPVEDDTQDLVLLLGPLYHLAHADDRDRALAEARRITRPGGTVLAAGISRLSSFTDTYLAAMAGRHDARRGEEWDDAWRDLLADGWIDATEVAFPFGHFHTSAELASELCAAGLEEVEVHGIEGPIGVAAEHLPADDPSLDALMGLARRFSMDGSLRDASPHLLAVGRVPGAQLRTR